MTPEITYLTNSTQLQGIADAIRSKAGTSESMVYPDGFISAIENIPTGDGNSLQYIYDASITDLFSVTNLSTVGLKSFAFLYCENLREVNFPSCTTIGASAFRGCISLETITFPACTSIANYAFLNCTSLSTVSFPSCEYIGSSAFCDCWNLISISFPLCSYIGSNAFGNCSKLTSVDFPLCKNIMPRAFYGCSSLSTVLLSNCSSIGSSAFYGCSNLSMVRLSNCEYIGNSAFLSCVRLTGLYLLGSSVCSLYNSSAFMSTPIGGYSTYAGYGTIYVPQSLVAAYQSASVWSYFSSVIYPIY